MRCTVCDENKPKSAFQQGRKQCKRCRLDIKRAQYDPEKQKAINDRRTWKVRAWRYGLTEDELTAMWDAQDYRCAICRKMTRTPSVDHCHETGQVRGLLCQKCNIMLGQANDSAQRLQAAIDYLLSCAAK